jgi:hypothetical protein
MFVGGKWYLPVVCDIPDPEKIGIEDVLGVDFGCSKASYASATRHHSRQASPEQAQREGGPLSQTPTTLFPRRLLLPPNAPVLRLRWKT